MNQPNKTLKRVTSIAYLITLVTTVSSQTFAGDDLSVRLRRPPHDRNEARGDIPPGPREKPSEAVIQLFERDREAISESESEEIRDEIRALYKETTNETDREAIRRFFARNPSSVSNSDGSAPRSSFRPSANGGVTQ